MDGWRLDIILFYCMTAEGSSFPIVCRFIGICRCIQLGGSRCVLRILGLFVCTRMDACSVSVTVGPCSPVLS